jgi:predicted esterase
MLRAIVALLLFVLVLLLILRGLAGWRETGAMPPHGVSTFATATGAVAAQVTGPADGPPILLVHGDRDEVIPVDALFLSTDALAAAEVPCQWHLSIGLGHGIDAEALRHGGLFLAQSFGLPYPG